MNLAAATVVGHVDIETQRQLVADIRTLVGREPWITPYAGGLKMSVRIFNVGPWGWLATNDHRGYHYADRHPVTGKPWPAIPQHWLELATRFAGDQRWDCAHLVRYLPGAKLGWHRDKTEADLSGSVVTISLGDPAKWDVMDEDDRESSTMIYTGDVVLLAGETRHLRHRIARVDASTTIDLLTPSPLAGPGRIALSIRSDAGPRT